MTHRVQALFERTKNLSIDCMMIYKPENVRYLSGFTGEGVLFLHKNRLAVITDSRYTEQALAQAPGFEILQTAQAEFELLAQCLASASYQRIGFEEDIVNVATYEKLCAIAPADCYVPLGDAVTWLRAVKDEQEAAAIQKACAITDLGFDFLTQIICPGITEKQISVELGYFLVKSGADGASFSSIVASGANGSMPHAIPTDKKIVSGELVTVDFGCLVAGYASDMTRTFAVGQVSDELKKIYGIVKQAQQTAQNSVMPGKTGFEIDRIARDIITEYGYGENFEHGTGHGVGLEIHELPRLSRMAAEHVLQPNMFVTVEPGIYIPGFGGVRVEDTVRVTPTGHESMFNSTKELVVL